MQQAHKANWYTKKW